MREFPYFDELIPVGIQIRERHQNISRSPPEAAEILLQIYKFYDNSKNTFSSDQYLGAILIALGNISLPTHSSTPKASEGQGSSIIESGNEGQARTSFKSRLSLL